MSRLAGGLPALFAELSRQRKIERKSKSKESGSELLLARKKQKSAQSCPPRPIG